MKLRNQQQLAFSIDIVRYFGLVQKKRKLRVSMGQNCAGAHSTVVLLYQPNFVVLYLGVATLYKLGKYPTTSQKGEGKKAG